MENVKNVILKQVIIIDPASAHHLKKKDVHIQNGKIVEIKDKIKAEGALEISYPDSYLTPAFLDLQARIGEPGNEVAETFVSASQAAMSGGYGDVLAFPSHHPPTTQAAQISYIKQNHHNGVQFLPAGCVSEQHKGQQLAELFDMHQAGAVAFTDDKQNISTALLARALEYTKTFDGLIMVFPLDNELNPGGMMHEGKTSTLMGTKGLSRTSEFMRIQRDLEILKYVGGRLHITHVSCAESVDLIRKAKKQKLAVTCSMAAHQLSYIDEDMTFFPTNLKVLPPFRTQKDRESLIEGLKDQTIDCIVSDHTPVVIEDKAVEFEFAQFGISSLQSAFLTALTATEGDLSIAELTAHFNTHPARILGLSTGLIEKGQAAKCTFFTLSQNTTLNKKEWKSKSLNNPFIGETLRGAILHTFLPKL
jgi:dihydroorotase